MKDFSLSEDVTVTPCLTTYLDPEFCFSRLSSTFAAVSVDLPERKVGAHEGVEPAVKVHRTRARGWCLGSPGLHRPDSGPNGGQLPELIPPPPSSTSIQETLELSKESCIRH